VKIVEPSQYQNEEGEALKKAHHQDFMLIRPFKVNG
jgi:hypothetical protein